MTTEPLTPSGCDLRGFPFMPLDVVRLRDSDIAAISTGDEFRCAVLLWCASWHQIPAASLPDDDIILAQLAGFGRVVKEWKKVREGSLRGWMKCSDGRLYHPVVAEKANEAWERKLEQAWHTECARIKKINQRHELTGDSAIPYPSIEQFLSPHYEPPKAPFKQQMSPGTKQDCPEGQDSNVPGKSPGKPNPIDSGQRQRQRQGQGQGQLSKQSSPEPEPLSRSLDAVGAMIPDPPKAESHWMTWFNREAGTSFDAGSRFDRESLWPIFRRWCDSGITQQQMRDALTKAHAEATEPIACLPKYVDRVLANSQAPKREAAQRQSPGKKTAEAAERWLASQGATR